MYARLPLAVGCYLNDITFLKNRIHVGIVDIFGVVTIGNRDSELQVVAFVYEGKKAYIRPLGSKKYDSWYGTDENEVKKTYVGLEKLMTDKLYNGKSLEDIADKITPKYY